MFWKLLITKKTDIQILKDKYLATNQLFLRKDVIFYWSFQQII